MLAQNLFGRVTGVQKGPLTIPTRDATRAGLSRHPRRSPAPLNRDPTKGPAVSPQLDAATGRPKRFPRRIGLAYNEGLICDPTARRPDVVPNSLVNRKR